jgi:two-component system chemotaxis response regulator CheY
MDGDHAVDMAEKLKPDLILLDVLMPKVSGIEALRNIRLVLPHVKVLMVTSSKEQDTVAEAVKTGISGYIVKPFNAKKVIDVMAAITQQILESKKVQQT